MKRVIERLGIIPWLLSGLALAASGLMALNYIVDNWWPFDVNYPDLVRATALGRADAATMLEVANREIIFLFLLAVLLTVTGLTLPVAYFLNKRFELLPEGSSRFLVTFRQSFWVGLWAAFCLWLQMNRTLSLAVAGLVATVLILFEFLLQVRARATDVTRKRVTR